MGNKKWLVAMDMDSTLITVELIDEVAKAHGVAKEVTNITKRAMAGAMDFKEALRQRVALLQGFSESVLSEMVNHLELSAGAQHLITTLKCGGHKVGVITGGFEPAGKILKARLHLDFVFCNTLEIRRGVLTGRVLEPIIDAQGKADALKSVAAQHGIPLEQTVAIGDGANDKLMLQAAGIGIAFHPKSDLSPWADVVIDSGGLDQVIDIIPGLAHHSAKTSA